MTYPRIPSRGKTRSRVNPLLPLSAIIAITFFSSEPFGAWKERLGGGDIRRARMYWVRSELHLCPENEYAFNEPLFRARGIFQGSSVPETWLTTLQFSRPIEGGSPARVRCTRSSSGSSADSISPGTGVKSQLALLKFVS